MILPVNQVCKLNKILVYKVYKLIFKIHLVYTFKNTVSLQNFISFLYSIVAESRSSFYSF
nr:MAG TPA: hypothetical protein [Caudoviricetes sp.]